MRCPNILHELVVSGIITFNNITHIHKYVHSTHICVCMCVRIKFYNNGKLLSQELLSKILISYDLVSLAIFLMHGYY